MMSVEIDLALRMLTYFELPKGDVSQILQQVDIGQVDFSWLCCQLFVIAEGLLIASYNMEELHNSLS